MNDTCALPVNLASCELSCWPHHCFRCFPFCTNFEVSYSARSEIVSHFSRALTLLTVKSVPMNQPVDAFALVNKQINETTFGNVSTCVGKRVFVPVVPRQILCRVSRLIDTVKNVIGTTAVIHPFRRFILLAMIHL